MAETDPQPEGDLEDRVERLEGSTGRIERMLEQLTGAAGKAHDAAEEHEEKHLDRPSSVAEMVKAELQKAEQEKAKADADAADKSERQSMKERLDKLMEAKPVAPQPRRQRLMWGPR